MDATRDKHGREIQVGDLLKVYHFTGRRRKRYFMYKQVVGTKWLGGYGNKPKRQYFSVSHLSLGRDRNYYIGLDQGVLSDYEIIQGLDDIEERPKAHPMTPQETQEGTGCKT